MWAGILKFLGAFMSWWESRQLIEAGKVEERAKANEKVLNEIAAADSVRAPVGELRDDDGFKRK